MFKELTIAKKIFLQIFGDTKIIDAGGFPCLICNQIVPNINQHQIITNHNRFGQQVENRRYYYYYFDAGRSIIFSFITIFIIFALTLLLLPENITGYTLGQQTPFLSHYYIWYFLVVIYGIIIGLIIKRIFFNYIKISPTIRNRTSPIICYDLNGVQFFLGCIIFFIILLITYVVSINPMLDMFSKADNNYLTNFAYTSVFANIFDLLILISIIGLIISWWKHIE